MDDTVSTTGALEYRIEGDGTARAVT